MNTRADIPKALCLIVSEIVSTASAATAGAGHCTHERLHGRHKIANADFPYVLSTFVFEPIRWNARFGWRRWTETERLGWFWFWREVGANSACRLPMH